MPVTRVVLVGFADQSNLGLGYLEAVLRERGHEVSFLDARQCASKTAEDIVRLAPLVVGLSIIFQYATPQFGDLAAAVRRGGFGGFLCAGGHYPSLRPEEVLAAIPELDCVVRFEGELTLLELVDRLSSGSSWRDTRGIAFRDGGRVVTTALRPLVDDLDLLPFPARHRLDHACCGRRVAPLLASRGCPRRCSFCSIRRFYTTPPGSLRRVRSPANVVAEMASLHERHGVDVFLFQDDDFALMSARDRQWAFELAAQLERHDLADRILWKISCRADEVSRGVVERLREVGLRLVYLGIESGNPEGLATLNKGLTVEDNERALATLADLGMTVEYGFMLFDPSSSFDSVAANIAFIRRTSGGGTATVPFARTLPYAGTDLEESLMRSGRLRQRHGHPDYQFIDPRVDRWYAYLSSVFRPMFAGASGVHEQLKWARFELAVLARFQPGIEGLEAYSAGLRQLTAHANDVYCRVVEESAPHFSHPRPESPRSLEGIQVEAVRHFRWIQSTLAHEALGFLSPRGFDVDLLPAEEAELA
jgi:radical SAM superfamily enzyme YgiQ (UPF0313 family)